jgi:hypothetical protein|tara:strand:+ start:4743 stop:4997 length:255 start_codon:yes stop_codon:yes gene_type:complete
MEIETIENNILIAERVPPGDRWALIGNDVVHNSLTEALEAYFQITSEPCHFRLEPLNSKLFAIKEDEHEVVVEPPKRYNIYGDF